MTWKNKKYQKVKRMTIPVLVVKDDELLVQLIRSRFKETEFNIKLDPTVAEPLSIVQSSTTSKEAISLSVIDIVLPRLDDLLLTKELNALTDIGIIVLSNLNSQSDLIAGLAQDADDYICKPVNLLEPELKMGNISEHIKGSHQDSYSEEFIQYADFKLHPDNRTFISPNGEESRLTEAEHKVLICLIANAGKATSREKISREIGQPYWNPRDRTIDVLIARLRKKLSDDKDQKRIVTLRGKGYMLSI